MSRFDYLAVPLYCLLLGGVVWAVYGNPMNLQGPRLYEFLGYIIGLLLSAVILLAITVRVVTRPADARTPNETPSRRG